MPALLVLNVSVGPTVATTALSETLWTIMVRVIFCTVVAQERVLDRLPCTLGKVETQANTLVQHDTAVVPACAGAAVVAAMPKAARTEMTNATRQRLNICTTSYRGLTAE